MTNAPDSLEESSCSTHKEPEPAPPGGRPITSNSRIKGAPEVPLCAGCERHAVSVRCARSVRRPRARNGRYGRCSRLRRRPREPGSRRLEKRDQRVEIPDHDPHSRASSDDERDRDEQAANTHRLIGPDLSFPIVVIGLPHTSTDPLPGTRVTTSTTRGPPPQIGRYVLRRRGSASKSRHD
jgi:hypothetical protein